jgi:hypothetical protein
VTAPISIPKTTDLSLARGGWASGQTHRAGRASMSRSQPARVIQWSGGIGSWATAQRVAAEYGTQDMVLLFSDTLVEHPDLHRFSRDAAEQLGLPVTRVCEGRTPFEVFRDVRYLGNSRVAPCSRILKQDPAKRWLETHFNPRDTILYVGIDHAEAARRRPIVSGWAPWQVEFPMCEPPHLTKQDMLDWAIRLGLRPPALYYPPYSLSHNNCGGWCVRAGVRQWIHMLAVDPDGFAHAEAAEEELRHELGDVAILRDRRGGVTRPLPLSRLRQRTAA